jgi:hypothetical protein
MDADVVIVCASASALGDLLAQWGAVLMKPLHLIIVVTNELAGKPTIPAGYDADVYTPQDARRLLGDKAWMLCSPNTLGKSFGYLVAKKKYVFTIGRSQKVFTISMPNAI